MGPVGRPGRAGRHGSLSRDLLDLAQRRVVTKSSAEACEHSVEALRAGADLAADGPWQGRREVASLNARHRPPESLEPRARSPAEEPRSRHAQDGDPEPQSSEDRHVTAGRRDRHGGRRTGQQEPTRRTDGHRPTSRRLGKAVRHPAASQLHRHDPPQASLGSGSGGVQADLNLPASPAPRRRSAAPPRAAAPRRRTPRPRPRRRPASGR